MKGASPPEAVNRLIQWIMLSDVLIGIALVALGAFVLDIDAMVIAGAGLAVIGFAGFLFFRMLGRRQSSANPSAPRKSPHDLRR